MKAQNEKTQLHLGCGKRFIPGFIHIDLDYHDHIDYRHKISSLPMFRDNSVDLIYCCHAFEYFDREEAKAVLAEWYRVLKPGGILRLAVPDFKAIIKDVYLKSKDLEHKGILGPLYGRLEIKTNAGRKTIYHRTAYDFLSLKKLLTAMKFRQVRRYDWRQTIHKDYDDCSQAYIPHLDKEHGILISLNVESSK
jgi:predicted SAM-dependent methyltransferase